VGILEEGLDFLGGFGVVVFSGVEGRHCFFVFFGFDLGAGF